MPSTLIGSPFLWTTPAKNVSHQLILHPTQRNSYPDQRHRQIINPRPEHTLFEWAAFRDHQKLLQRSKEPLPSATPSHPIPEPTDIPPPGISFIQASDILKDEIPTIQTWAKKSKR